MPEDGSESRGEAGGESATIEEAVPPEAGPDEVYCIECGEVIKERAEICPECGVRQTFESGQTDQMGVGHLSAERQRELEKMASNDTTGVVIAGLLLTPVAYLMVGKVGLAILNFFTFNYFLLGPIVVPVHCHQMIKNAEDELRQAGVSGY